MTTTTLRPEALMPVVRTSEGLRDLLFDEIDRMRKGETNAKDANSLARLASEIINTVRIELEIAQFKTRTAPSAKLVNPEIPPLTLGRVA